jgi:hypothetical protein
LTDARATCAIDRPCSSTGIRYKPTLPPSNRLETRPRVRLFASGWLTVTAHRSIQHQTIGSPARAELLSTLPLGLRLFRLSTTTNAEVYVRRNETNRARKLLLYVGAALPCDKARLLNSEASLLIRQSCCGLESTPSTPTERILQQRLGLCQTDGHWVR